MKAVGPRSSQIQALLQCKKLIAYHFARVSAALWLLSRDMTHFVCHSWSYGCSLPSGVVVHFDLCATFALQPMLAATQVYMWM